MNIVFLLGLFCIGTFGILRGTNPLIVIVCAVLWMLVVIAVQGCKQ